MGDVVKLALVKPAPSRDTVDTLQALLAEAKAGKLCGIAFVALYASHGRVDYDATGTALEASRLTRVALRDLDDKLALLK